MKETIEFERPEGLPKGAVPAVVFVAPKPGHSDLYETFQPNGILRSTVSAEALRHTGLPVPEVFSTRAIHAAINAVDEGQEDSYAVSSKVEELEHHLRVLSQKAMRAKSETSLSDLRSALDDVAHELREMIP